MASPARGFWKRALVGEQPARTLARIVVLIAVSVVVFGWVLIPVRAVGDSMLPTLQSGSFHLVNRLSYLFRLPARGDVVAVRFAGPHVMYIKRVVGMPGERIAIRDGVLEVDGGPFAEPYARLRARWDTRAVHLGPEEYFVIGDNRGMRQGEHDFGVVNRQRIVGPLLF